MAKKKIETVGKYRLGSESVFSAHAELNSLEVFTATEMELEVEIAGEDGETSKEVRLVTLDGLDNEVVMRYIIMMYALGSGYIDSYPKIGKRKTKIMEMLNIAPNKENKYDRNVSDMLANKNRLILKKIAAFLTLQCSSDWAIMLKSQEDLEEVLSMKLPEDPTKQVARQKAIEDIRKQIEECKKRMLENDKSKILEQEVSEFVAYATLGLRVEERVMQNYKVEKPHQAKGGKIYSEVGD
jgi:hypothetical protein